jgi:hypothetical protein
MSNCIRLDTIKTVVAFPDTLGCLVRYPVPKDLWTRLRSAGAGKIVPSKPCQIGSKLYQPFRIQQPTRKTLNMLASLTGCMICRLDVAVDFICGSKEHASLVAAYFDRLLMQKWHGRRRKHRYKNSIYWSKEHPTARNIALYADRPSKTGMGPCAHVELRFFGAHTCRLVGVSTPHTLLQNVDVLRLLQRQTRLVQVDKRRFDRLIERAARARLRRHVTRHRLSNTTVSKIIWDQFNTVDGLQRRISGLFCRLLQQQEPTKIKAQEFVERLPNMRSCLISISWKHVCPHPQWGLLP